MGCGSGGWGGGGRITSTSHYLKVKIKETEVLRWYYTSIITIYIHISKVNYFPFYQTYRSIYSEEMCQIIGPQDK